MKATAVPSRPAATAPVATGSSAYDPASSTRAAVGVTSQRLARYAVRPASGTQPSSSTSTASHAWPPRTVPSAATTARYGGGGAAAPPPPPSEPPPDPRPTAPRHGGGGPGGAGSGARTARRPRTRARRPGQAAW